MSLEANLIEYAKACPAGALEAAKRIRQVCETVILVGDDEECEDAMFLLARVNLAIEAIGGDSMNK